MHVSAFYNNAVFSTVSLIKSCKIIFELNQFFVFVKSKTFLMKKLLIKKKKLSNIKFYGIELIYFSRLNFLKNQMMNECEC